MKVILQREASDDQGTYGVLTIGDTVRLQTLELPDRDNARGLSRIPAGVYRASPSYSPRFGKDLYELANVPGRSEILIHSGNRAGDKLQGYKTDVEGCILLGLSRGKLEGQKAVTASRDAMRQFEEMAGGQPITIEIRDA